MSLVVATERPLLTYVDGASGERTELTAAELGEWAARTAALLRDGCGLTAGSRIAVLLPPHWQTAAVLLGAWSVGIAVSVRLRATAGLPVLEPGGDEPLDATFVDRRRVDDWLEDVPAGRHQFVLRLGGDRADVPAGYRDFLAEVSGYPATAPAYQLLGGDAPFTADGTTYRQWATLAYEVAEMNGIRAGDRVEVDADEQEQPVHWLLAPLVAGASVVLRADRQR